MRIGIPELKRVGRWEEKEGCWAGDGAGHNNIRPKQILTITEYLILIKLSTFYKLQGITISIIINWEIL